MRYALVIYNNAELRDRTPESERQQVTASIREALADRPEVAGWVRLQDFESATTVSTQEGKTLLTDGPFVDSKDFLGGFILVDAESLDGALAVADELQHLRGAGAGAIEVRPVREEG